MKKMEKEKGGKRFYFVYIRERLKVKRKANGKNKVFILFLF